MDWMNGWNGFSFCMEMLVAALIFMVYLDKRKRFFVKVAAGIGISFLCAVFIYPFFQDITNWYNWIWYILVYSVVILICYWCCNISFCDAVYCGSLGYLAQHIASTLYIIFSFRGSMPTWRGLRYYLVYMGVYILIFLICAKRLQDKGHYDVTLANAILTGILVLIIVLCLSALVNSTTIEATGVKSISEEYIKLFYFAQLYDVFICIIFLTMQFLQRNELRALYRLDQNQNMWEQRQKQYEMSKENINLINRKCHDLKHQIAALAQKEDDSVYKKSFVREVQSMIEVYDSDVSTGNEALDMILMEKSLYCRFHEIDWTCVADGKLLSFMDVVDLYTIMGNVLDNAVEGAEKCPSEKGKMIAVRIWKRDFFAVLQVENSYAGQIEFEDGLPRTSKEDKGSHGFGVRSIKAMAEKYGGSIHVSADDKMFTITILIPLP